MNSPKSILVVDDDLDIRETLHEYLSGRGLAVFTAPDGEQMKSVLQRESIDVVLLDLNLPGDSGIELTRYLRRKGRIGIIILTAVGDPEDRVLGLETGADDYLVKPFNLRELLARINSVLRRLDDSLIPGSSRPRVGKWTLDADSGSLVKEDGSRVDLSAGEYDLLELLLKNIGSPVSRDLLLQESSQRELEPYDRSIDVRIARLRKKIEGDVSHPKLIRTVRNVGYMLTSES